MPLISASILDIVPDTLKVLDNFLLDQRVKMAGRQPKSTYFLGSEWYSLKIPEKYFLYSIGNWRICKCVLKTDRQTNRNQDWILRETIALTRACLGRSHGWFHTYWLFPNATTDENDTSFWQMNGLLSIGLWCALVMIKLDPVKSVTCISELETVEIRQFITWAGI